MRKLSAEERRNLPRLPVQLPASAHRSNPFSKSSHILYRRTELGVASSGQMDRTMEFRDRLLGIWTVINGPIPYAFRTFDGAIRSLDAGCMGMLSRGSDAILSFDEDEDGHIRAVRLSGLFIDRNEHRLDDLMAAVRLE